MTSILDSRDQIKALDKSNLLGSVEALPDQILDALTQTQDIVIPSEYKNVKNVVVSGMGGSVLGSYVIKGLFKGELTIPFEVVSHYTLPGHVSSDTLVLLSSYSGTTEETLASAQDAKMRGAKVMVITAGGPLAELAQKNNWPLYLMKATYNPSNQPRLAIGYAIAGQLALFAKAGILANQSAELMKVAAGLKDMIKRLAPESVDGNTAKLLAYAAFEKHIIISAAEHLVGAAHVFNNQVNENSKALTSEWHLPEFNHHYMEALQFPKANQETTIFFLFNSQLYNERVGKRFPITNELILAKGYETQLIQATGPSKLEQVFEIIQLGEFVAAYLPILYKIPDPGPVPNVEWFKAQMAK
jgi:glucose/mannose-6-phosphate isomerase